MYSVHWIECTDFQVYEVVWQMSIPDYHHKLSDIQITPESLLMPFGHFPAQANTDMIFLIVT